MPSTERYVSEKQGGGSKGELTAGENVPATNFRSMVNAGNLREGEGLNSQLKTRKRKKERGFKTHASSSSLALACSSDGMSPTAS